MHKLHPKLIDLSLDRLVGLLEKLGNPQHSLPPIIHIAGTNGKGSTTAYIKSILQAHGKHVHAYTSPHLVNFHERIHLANAPNTNANASPTTSADISESYLVKMLTEVIAANNGEAITFFEMTTAVGLLAFSRQPADYLILEVGLGGRFDATNVMAEIALAIITPVSIDHVQFLGTELNQIAFEKAGVIKPNCNLIIGPQQTEAFEVIEQVANRHNANMISYGVDFQAYEERGRLIYHHLSGLLDLPLPALQGAHQIQNASIAISAVKFLLADAFNETHTANGLKNTIWPARLQRLVSAELASLAPSNAEIWLDGGHNAAGGQAVAQLLSNLQAKDPRPLYLLIGMMNSKQADEFLQPFAKLNPIAYCLAIEDEANSFSPQQLAEMAKNTGIKTHTATHFTQALMAIKSECDQAARILICGSLYQAGNVLKYIQNHKKSR
ncbi:MAG: bifunctional folylpolyglutamate synthase/dihydrofolate synthase [Rhizobiales bacterium]|nr:bifunctional folylpolyglutamate synthase/dihydrofolate synthase [Hyphomicrobiales bacterium]